VYNNDFAPNARSVRVREPDHTHNVKGLQPGGLQPGLLLLLTTSITMAPSKKWSLPSLAVISHQLLDLYKKAAIVAAGVAAGAVAVPATLAIVGFAPAGIAAGEYLNPVHSLTFAHEMLLQVPLPQGSTVE
jgi:hypothetical protein